MKHILVVDDEADVAFLFQGFFEARGHRVTVAHDGAAALAADERDPADAVVTDLVMPGMDGGELIERLHRRRPDLPAIIVSGYAGGKPPTGPHTVFFSKPVRIGMLAESLDRLLAGAGPGPGQEF